MTCTNSSKFCKSCGDYRQIEDNKCTICDAEYSDGDITDIGQATDDNSLYLNFELSDKRLQITRRTLDASNETKTLDLEIGTIVSFINKSSDWYWVEYGEKKGWIPEDSTEKLSDMAQDCSNMAPNIPPRQVKCTSRVLLEKTQEEYVKALVDCDNNENSFHKGDIITVTDRKSDGYRDMIEGRIGTMEVKLPATHVKPYDNNPEPPPPTNPRKKSSKDWTQGIGAGPPLPPKPSIRSGKESKYLSFKKVNKFQKDVVSFRQRTRHSNHPARKNWIRQERYRKFNRGKEVFESTICGQSVTKKCDKSNGICNGRKIVLIDTPGLFDTNSSHETINSEIIRCVHLSLPGPHLFLIILQITRLTKEETEAVEKLFEIFENRFPSNRFHQEMSEPLHCDKQPATGQDKTKMVTDLVNLITDIVNDNNGGYFTNSLIDKAKEVQSAGNEEINQHRVDTPYDNQDEGEGDDSDDDEIDTDSVKSCDSGLSSQNQSVYEEICSGHTAKEIELNKIMQETESKINSTESEKQKLEKQKDKDMTKIELQLEENKKQVKEVTENLDLLNTQFSELKLQKEGVKNSFKVEIEKRDTKLKNLHTKQTRFLKQIKNLEQKKRKSKQKLSKETKSLQNKMDTNENGCMMM
ncbi:unnamed protein product [Mytilus coruscus]|uniref:SH3 domain-containing protein n=1 Tax=Mytilus coruscus TaxID=42192 RepID=A0A6J8EBL5_MYTCO|nr:unnamed protein product [Mytilus coruscus]